MLLQMMKWAVSSILIQIVRCDSNYRLNTTITPISYGLTITPYFDTGDENAFTFDGEVNVYFASRENISQIKLHSDGLIFNAFNITITTGLTILDLKASNPLEFDEKYNFAIINLETELLAGVEYNLKILYQGYIQQGLAGFYRNYYIDKGVKKWLGTTHFQPTYARMAFPCFDEPELKAIFTLTIVRPEHYHPSITNTKMQSSQILSNGYIREVFHPTPRMPTYLVSFLISEFEAVVSTIDGSNEFGIYTRPEAKNQSEFAFDFGRRVVKALGDYFGIDYYTIDSHLKLDHVALTDFGPSAMENWGLVNYREALLLYVPEQSNPSYKYEIAKLMAHETTHMWFGNLVTCHWWNNIWLNEGFATYFQNYIIALIEPEVRSKDMFVVESVHLAYNGDDSPESTSITHEVVSPDEINRHFGTISYEKAGSIIRMMHHLIADEAFKLGLHTYLDKNRFQSVIPEMLYEGLHYGVKIYNALSMYPETNISDVFNSWIIQPGYPILQVNVNYEDSTVSLKQKRFFTDPAHKSNDTYKIPITYTFGKCANFDNTKPAFIMHDKTHFLNISDTCGPLNWVIFNIQETGFYRVNYDIKTWDLLIEELKGSDRNEIHHLNRAKILNDLFAFLYSGDVSFELLHRALGFLVDETDYSVWFVAIRGLQKLRTSFFGTNAVDDIERFALELMENSIRRLGYIVPETDSLMTQMNRMRILDFACKLEHRGCVDNMLALYKDLKENGKGIPPSLRPAAYCTGLRYGNTDDFRFLWDRMSTTNVANEGLLIGELLGCSSDTNRIRHYLMTIFDENSPIMWQDLMLPLQSVLSNYNHIHIVLEELSEIFNQWMTIYPSFVVLPNVASALHTEKEFNEFESWLSQCEDCDEESIIAGRKALDKARMLATWADNHKNTVLETLKSTNEIE